MTPNFTAAVETMFESVCQTLYPSMEYRFSNTPVADSVEAYTTIHIMSSVDVTPINLGIKAKSRNVGVIQIDVYTPLDKGAGQARRISYALSKEFKRVTHIVAADNGLITFKDPSIQDRGEIRGRHKHMATIPYRYDFNDTV